MINKECPACFEIIECDEKVVTNIACPQCKVPLFSYLTDPLLTDYQYYLLVTKKIKTAEDIYKADNYSGIPIASTVI